ncbi:hypothetical protein GGR56DRAFT_695578 [Xylariaceae sp. FL0804]|nr:hypothetical protein GGR56DRAFT_695578 [Xylariaceae sp. FL0804]
MCIANSKGFPCGHADPNGTPLQPDYCGPPRRRLWEPMCDPPDGHKLHLSGPADGPLCPACQAAIRDCERAWAATKAAWLSDGILPASEVARVDRAVERSRWLVTKMNSNRGPSHSGAADYAKMQANVRNKAEAFRNELIKLDVDWEKEVSALQGQSSPWTHSFRRIELYVQRRTTARQQVLRRGLEEFKKYEQGLLDEMNPGGDDDEDEDEDVEVKNLNWEWGSSKKKKNLHDDSPIRFLIPAG